MQLVSIQKFFSSFFPDEDVDSPSSSQDKEEFMDYAKSTSSQYFASQSAECIDLSNCMEDTEVTVPTLNG